MTGQEPIITLKPPGAELGGWKIQQHRQIDFLNAGLDGVAEHDVDHYA
jgi:hypothetical protein